LIESNDEAESFFQVVVLLPYASSYAVLQLEPGSVAHHGARLSLFQSARPGKHLFMFPYPQRGHWEEATSINASHEFKSPDLFLNVHPTLHNTSTVHV
jgi:hypothetical protein